MNAIKQFYNPLEMVFALLVAEERDGVGHHPNVSPPAVEVRLRPNPVLVSHAQDFFFEQVRLVARVPRKTVVS